MSRIKGSPGPMPPSKAWQAIMQGQIVKIGTFGEGEYVEFRIPTIDQSIDTLTASPAIIPIPDIKLMEAAYEMEVKVDGIDMVIYFATGCWPESLRLQPEWLYPAR